MPTLRRPKIPTHVLERQPQSVSDIAAEAIRPSWLMRSLKRLMPQIIDLPVAEGSVVFVTETSPMGYHSLTYKIRESGRVVADRFQPPTGQGCVWTNSSHLINGPGQGTGEPIRIGKEGCKPENQPLYVRHLKDLGVFPVLEDPDFIPGEAAVLEVG